MIESGLLEALLLNIIFGGAAGVAIWWFVESKAGKNAVAILADWLGYFGLEPPEVTRYLAMTLSVLVSLVIHVVLVFAFVLGSSDTATWVDPSLELFAIAYATSQICHARRKTRLALDPRQWQHPLDPVTTTLD